MKYAFLLPLAAALLALPAQASTPKEQPKIQIVDQGWGKRCLPASAEGQACEIVNNLTIEGTDTRLAEFAVGFPNKDNTTVAQGAVMLPLGILLEKGVVMRVDEEKAYKFKIHSCSESGCLSYVDLGTDLIDSMRKGNKVAFTFTDSTGREINLLLSLGGFTKALKGIM